MSYIIASRAAAKGSTIVAMLSLLALAALVALPTQALIRFPCGQLVTERFDPYAVCISSVVAGKTNDIPDS